MIHFPAKKHLCAGNYFQYIFHIIQLKFPKFYPTRPEDSKVLSPYLNHMRKFCKVKPIHRNHVFGMTVFYQFQITGNDKGLICHDEKVAYRPFLQYYTSFQSTNPFPISSSSMARAITLRLSALKGSAYCLAFICSVAASTPPLLLSFSSST